MRASVALAVAVLLAPTSSLRAELQTEAATPDRATSQASQAPLPLAGSVDAHVAELSGSPAPASGQGGFNAAEGPLRPAELVASRVREVLRDHSDDVAWQELAGALPEMALSGGADIQSTFEAARIAEDMVPVATPVPSASSAAAGAAFEEVLRLVRGIDVDMAGQLLAIAFGLFALTMLFKGSGNRARGARSEPAKGRCREARALAAGGVPVYEIAKRTGLAREAVSVLLSQGAR